MPAKTTPSVSLIITVFNEDQTILKLLQSIKSQTLIPQETIINDAGSTDQTVQIISKFSQNNPQLKIKLIKQASNRSQGRNLCISKAKNKLIAITDAGCILDKNWLKELLAKHKQTKAPVIAGYYQGLPKTPFQEAVVPYALVMPNKLDPKKTFLPSTRSMLITKSIWKKTGGFDNNLNYSEDYEFSRRLKSQGFKIAFAKKAIAGWIPRKNLLSFIKMIANFARGDIKAGILRPKVSLIFARYLLGIVIATWLLFNENQNLQKVFWPFVLICLFLYSAWAIKKNHKYTPRGWYYLPILQISSDLAVMWGTILSL